MVQNSHGLNPYELYTVDQVANMLKVCRKTLFNYRAQGLIECVETNRTIKFSGNHIAKFIDDHTVKELKPSKKNNY